MITGSGWSTVSSLMASAGLNHHVLVLFENHVGAFIKVQNRYAAELGGSAARLGHVEGGHEDTTEDSKQNDSEYFDPHCQECRTVYKDPPSDTLVMYLHALRYSGQGWSYHTDLPAWATLQ